MAIRSDTDVAFTERCHVKLGFATPTITLSSPPSTAFWCASVHKMRSSELILLL